MTLDPLNCNWVSTSTTNIYNISRSYSRNETLRGIYTCTKRMINTTKTLYCRSEKIHSNQMRTHSYSFIVAMLFATKITDLTDVNLKSNMSLGKLEDWMFYPTIWRVVLKPLWCQYSFCANDSNFTHNKLYNRMYIEEGWEKKLQWIFFYDIKIKKMLLRKWKRFAQTALKTI